MTSAAEWIALGLVLATAAQGLAAWYLIHRLRRPRRRPPVPPSPLAILESQVATGRMTPHQFTKSAAALRDHDLDR